MIIKAADAYRFHCPLYGFDGKGVPRIYGTLTLVEYDSIPLILTCAHVVDLSSETKFFIHLAGNTVVDNFKFSGFRSDQLLNDDGLDIAIEVLPSTLHSALKERFSFYSLSSSDTVCADGDHHYITGFPITKTKVFSGTIITEYFSFFTRRVTNITEVGNYKASDNIFLSFPKKRIHSILSNLEESPPCPTGISGGGIWELTGDPNEPLHMSATLVAIAVERDKHRKLIIGTKIISGIDRILHNK